jgi:hypothetical protein
MYHGALQHSSRLYSSNATLLSVSVLMTYSDMLRRYVVCGERSYTKRGSKMLCGSNSFTFNSALHSSTQQCYGCDSADVFKQLSYTAQ